MTLSSNDFVWNQTYDVLMVSYNNVSVSRSRMCVRAYDVPSNMANHFTRGVVLSLVSMPGDESEV